MDRKVRVIIFDDNSHRRDGLKMLIDAMETMECVGCHEDCRKVLEDIEQAKPDVVLMDIDMPHVNGVEAVEKIRTKYTDLKVLMQTVFEDDNKIFSAICAGADGYILKQRNPSELIDAIFEVMTGGAPMTPIVARKALQLFRKSNSIRHSQEFNLSNRELEILELLTKGYSYKMIADKCFISYATVNSHISKIYQKLQVESSAGAVSLAIREGLVK